MQGARLKVCYEMQNEDAHELQDAGRKVQGVCTMGQPR